MDNLDTVAGAAIEAAQPRIDELRRSLGRAYSAERLKQAASLDQVHRLIAGVVVMLQEGPIAQIKQMESRVTILEAGSKPIVRIAAPSRQTRP